MMPFFEQIAINGQNQTSRSCVTARGEGMRALLQQMTVPRPEQAVLTLLEGTYT
jgi:hypothetical protein